MCAVCRCNNNTQHQAAPAAPTTTVTSQHNDGNGDNHTERYRKQQHQQHSVSVTLPIEQYDIVERLLQLEFPLAGPIEQSVPIAFAHQQ